MHEDVLNTEDGSCGRLVNVVELIVATPVIVLAIGVVASVAAAVANRSHGLGVTSSCQVDVALCVLVGDPALLEVISAGTEGLVDTGLLNVMAEDWGGSSGEINALLGSNVASLNVTHAGVTFTPRFDGVSLGTSDEENSNSCK